MSLDVAASTTDAFFSEKNERGILIASEVAATRVFFIIYAELYELKKT